MVDLWRKIVIKTWEDVAFKKKLFSNPKKTIEALTGTSLPKGIKIEVHEQTETTFHLVIPVLPLDLTKPINPNFIWYQGDTTGGTTEGGYDCPYHKPTVKKTR